MSIIVTMILPVYLPAYMSALHRSAQTAAVRTVIEQLKPGNAKNASWPPPVFVFPPSSFVLFFVWQLLVPGKTLSM